MSDKVIEFGKPSAKQSIFLKARKHFVCFGGARGGGKSWVVRFKAVLLCLAYPGIKVMIIRKSYPELTENHIKPLLALLKCYDSDKQKRIANYVDQKKTITFPNGSEILFRYCDNDKDIHRFQGTECDVMFIDEATHFTEEQFKKLCACVRGVNNFPKRVYLTCNPGGVGHQWVKRLFVDRNFENNERAEDYEFIQSLPTDNYALMKADPDYIKNLEALPAKIRAAWLYGDWNVFSGQFFEEWRNDPEHYEDKRYSHVIEPFYIPLDWKIYRSFDWGYAKPFSCGWWAEDYDGTLYRIYEWYGCSGEPDEGLRLDADKVFKRIKEIELEHPLLRGKKIVGVADPAIWQKDGGYSLYDIACRYKVYFQKGDHKRIPGWNQCHYRLAFDENGFSRVYVFKTCKDFIRIMPMMMHDDNRVEDCNTKLEDHAADEFRYMCMLRTIKPRKNIKPRPIGDDPLDLMKELK